MQDHKDPRAFTIVERYAHESSQKYHLENPVSVNGSKAIVNKANFIVLSIVLADFRQVRDPVARQGHGSPSTQRAGHFHGGQGRAGPSTVGEREEAPDLLE